MGICALPEYMFLPAAVVWPQTVLSLPPFLHCRFMRGMVNMTAL
jgi:hypothetical protein